MKVCVFNLGCKVNQYENDVMVARLKPRYEVTTDLEPADIYIVNTCAVTNEAEKKSRQVVSRIKKLNEHAPIYICGCASQNNKEQFLHKDNVVYVSGTASKYMIPDVLMGGDANPDFELPMSYEEGSAKSLRTRAYIKVQDGCNNFCSYCLIPYVRGRSRSRELGEIIKEATAVSESVREIVLVGINLSDYKIGGNLALIDIIEALGGLKSRVRLSSLEVNIITEDFLDRLSRVPNFCPHFHLSLQSGSDKVLKAMNRRYTRQEYIAKCKLIYKYFPDAAITTDIIVGFPTETEEDFQDTIDLVKEVGFMNVHYFAYSSRQGTVASKKYKVLNGDVVKKRELWLEKIAKEVNKEFLLKHFDKQLKVLTEDLDGDYMVGFSDNYIKCYIDKTAKPNRFYTVKPSEIVNNGYRCEILAKEE